MSDINEDTLDQEKLFGKKIIETPVIEEFIDKVETSTKKVKELSYKDIPYGYISVNLDSMEKLNAPMTLHFRDFSLEELNHISLSKNERDNIKRITKCLNDMVLENFDCTYFHLNELLQITFTLFGSFVSKTIEKKYYINPDLPEGKEEGQLDNPKNIAIATIPIGNIKTCQLKDSFSEPLDLSMEINGKTMTTLMRMIRVKDLLEAEEYVNKHFEKDIRQLSNIEIEIERIKKIENEQLMYAEYEKIPESDRQMYEKFTEEYTNLYISVLTSLSVIQAGSNKPKTISEHIKCAKFINRGQWKKFDVWNSENEFGLLPDVTFYSPELQKEVTRRFLFQPNDFIDTES